MLSGLCEYLFQKKRKETKLDRNCIYVAFTVLDVVCTYTHVSVYVKVQGCRFGTNLPANNGSARGFCRELP